MQIKQLTYTSLENGWTIERAVGDTTLPERKAFAGICSQRSINFLYSFDFRDGIYILANSAPNGFDIVNRRNLYTHGYLFSQKDADELFKNYGLLLGIDYFAKDTTDELYPIGNDSSCFSEKLDIAGLPLLVECVYEALAFRKGLEILADDRDRVLAVKRIMNTVYSYLPLSLRKQITFASGTGNIMRTVTVTNCYSGMTDLTYDLSIGTANGVKGTYAEYVEKLFTPEKDSLIERLESKIKVYGPEDLFDNNQLKKAVVKVLKNDNEDYELKSTTVIDSLIDLLVEGEYSISGNAGKISEMLRKVISGNIKCSENLYVKLAEVYSKTDSDKLKDDIVDLLALNYGADCNAAVFEKFLVYQQISQELFVRVTNTAVEKEYMAFIELCAENAFNNYGYAVFLKNKCSVKCVNYIALFVVDRLLKNQSKALMDKVTANNIFHKDVIEGILKNKEDNDVILRYFRSVYSSAESFEIYKELTGNIVKMCINALCEYAAENKAECMDLFQIAYTNLGEYAVTYIFEQFIEYGHGKIIEDYYAEVVSKSAKNENDFELYKNQLSDMGITTDNFVRCVLSRYAGFCFEKRKDNKEKLSDSILRIKNFAGESMMLEGGEFDEIKTVYWDKFRFNNLKNITDDVKLMSLSDNKKSILANALFNLYENVSGKTYKISVSDIKICADNLCSKSSILNLKNQINLLHSFKKLANRKKSDIDIDVYMLINYSRIRKRVDFRQAALTATELEKYLARKSDMLGVKGVHSSLYRYIHAKEEKKKKKDIRKSFEYSYLLNLMKPDTTNAIKASDSFYKSGIQSLKLFGVGIASVSSTLILNAFSGGRFVADAICAVLFSASEMQYIIKKSQKKTLHEKSGIWLFGVMLIICGLYFLFF